MARASAAGERRRRRSPEEAEREILEAGERLLKQRPLHELTVRAVMDETTLSRNSFYVYFRDRYDLIGRLVGRLRAGVNVTMAEFTGSADDPAAAGKQALYAAAQMYLENGRILRALQQAARSDPSAGRAWEEFTRPAEEAVIARLEKENLNRPGDPDPEQLVRVLFTMTRATLFELADDPHPDIDRVVETLQRIWQRALFP